MCPDRETISAYYDGELDGPAAGMIETHIRSCERCSTVVESFAGLRLRLEPDEPLVERGMLEVSRRHIAARSMIAPGRSWKNSLRIPTPVAAVAAALIIVLGLGLLLALHDGSTHLFAEETATDPFGAVFEYLDSRQLARPVVFRLPESAQFRVVSEPALIRASEHRRVTE